MGLNVGIDCGCIARGQVMIPDRWRSRVIWSHGCPMFDEGEKWPSDEGLELVRWYRYSCEHQCAVNELTSSRVRAIWDLAEGSGISQMDALFQLFNSPTGGGEVTPRQSEDALNCLQRLKLANPQTALCPQLSEVESGEVIELLIGGSGLMMYGKNRQQSLIDEGFVDKDGVRLSRVRLNENGMRQGDLTLLLETRLFVQRRCSADEHGFDVTWTDIASKKSVNTGICFGLGGDHFSSDSSRPARTVRWQLVRPPVLAIIEPLQVACQASVTYNVPLGWDR